ncbi:MAG: murein L,D-transpeptidase catalytic domain family protein [Nitrincola sp.]|nr:murein L,D-transpeptidase catalytic domain family protein [Nitrincola sp.]
MSLKFTPLKGLFLASLIFSSTASAQFLPHYLTDKLAIKAPELNKQVLNKALLSMQCATNNGLPSADRLAVIDFSLPSTEKRLWIFDLANHELLLEELVAHGNNTGDKYATDFSNIVGSHQSSIGLFRTQESYFGRHGYSLRLDGLEPGVNDNARERAIVIHAADYVDPEWIERYGRIGRSQGCPAVRPEVVDQVVDNLKDGQFLFTFYPDQNWLESSAFLNCQPQRVAQYVAPFSPSGSRQGS